MFSRNRFLVLLTAVFSLVWLIGFSAADAQQSPPNPTTKSPTPTPTPRVTDEDEVIKVDTDVVNVLFTAQITIAVS